MDALNRVTALFDSLGVTSFFRGEHQISETVADDHKEKRPNRRREYYRFCVEKNAFVNMADNYTERDTTAQGNPCYTTVVRYLDWCVYLAIGIENKMLILTCIRCFFMPIVRKNSLNFQRLPRMVVSIRTHYLATLVNIFCGYSVHTRNEIQK